MYVAKMESKTHARNNDAHLLTTLTPIKTTAARRKSNMVPYTLMLFNITDEVAPPLEWTSPNKDIPGAM